MNGSIYNFDNTGYKIHLPVKEDSNNPLTRQIVDFLDKKFGLPTNNAANYMASNGIYKVGVGGCLTDSSGITLYGKTSSLDEMKALADEIEAKFGKELEANIKRYNLQQRDPLYLTKSVQCRFNCNTFQQKAQNPAINYFVNPSSPTNGEPWLHMGTYSAEGNPSGALPLKYFKRPDGSYSGTENYWGGIKIKNMPELDKKFFFGDSTMYAVDNFGELFTGKIENGKVPQFIMDGLPAEYLQYYNLTEKDIIQRIDKGTKQIVANMLEDVVNDTNSKILASNAPWFTTLEPKVIDEAKQLLAQYEPQTVQKLEQILPQLEQKCPALGVLNKTTPFAKMKIQPMQNPTATPKPQASNPVHTPTNPTTAAQQTTQESKGWLKNMSKEGKIGLAIAGAALSAAAVYGIIAQGEAKKQKELAKTIRDSVVKADDNPISFEAKIAQKPLPYTGNYGNMTI